MGATYPVSDVNTWFYVMRAIDATRGPSAWTELALVNRLEDEVVKVTAEASTAPQPEITLEWLVQKNHYLDEFGAVRDDEYVIRRKQLGESEWTTLVLNATESLPVSMHTDGMLSWTDRWPAVIVPLYVNSSWEESRVRLRHAAAGTVWSL